MAAIGLPHIVVLATGGTIAGSATSGTQPAYDSGQVRVDQLLAAVPQLGELARISAEQVANVGSQDMSDEIWVRLAARVNELLARDDVQGVVITHGTDTLEETAYFLHLVVHSDKPVVMTAAMRPSTALSADGPLNMFNAVAVAVDPQACGRGVLVVIHDDIHGARATTKSHTTYAHTFQSHEEGLVGTTVYGRNTFFRHPYRKHTFSSSLSVEGVQALPRVDILYMHAGAAGDLVDASVARGARGLVLAGVGNGNMNAEVRTALRRAVQAGVAVVRSSRVPGGATSRNIEIDDDRLGTVASGELNPAKSRVLLQLALLQNVDAVGLRALFDTY